MIHLYALVAFFAAVGLMAAAADRYADLDEAADLCRGQQPDQTPLLTRKALDHQACKHGSRATDHNPHQEARS